MTLTLNYPLDQGKSRILYTGNARSPCSNRAGAGNVKKTAAVATTLLIAGLGMMGNVQAVDMGNMMNPSNFHEALAAPLIMEDD